jgi:hypothetical protein
MKVVMFGRNYYNEDTDKQILRISKWAMRSKILVLCGFSLHSKNVHEIIVTANWSL